MKFRLLVLTVVAGVLLGGALSQAGIIGTAVQVSGPPPGAAWTGTSAPLNDLPWASYKLGLQATAGELMGAVEVTINGALHQRWTVAEDPETGEIIITPTPKGTAVTGNDSHLIIPTTNWLELGVAEDNNLLNLPPGPVGSPLLDTATADYGVGTFLTGAWTFTGGTAPSIANIAYIVIPRGSEVTTDIGVKVWVASGDLIGDLDQDDFPGFERPIVPEPTTFALFGLALVGLVGLRRRG
jgi:hypothetical protein